MFSSETHFINFNEILEHNMYFTEWKTLNPINMG